MARSAGLEPATLGLEGRCSIQMSYERSKSKAYSSKIGRGRGIRTPDPLVPNQLRYQAALCPDVLFSKRERYYIAKQQPCQTDDQSLIKYLITINLSALITLGISLGETFSIKDLTSISFKLS